MSIKQVKDGCWVYSDGQQVCYPYPSGQGEASVLDSLIDRSITEVTSDARIIGRYSFRGCEKLTAVNFPKAVEIASGTFQECFSLIEIYAPLVTLIGQKAFYCSTSNTASLLYLDFPSATSIAYECFKNQAKLKEVNFPSLTLISDHAFSGCKALLKASFYEPYISSFAFEGCQALTAVIIRGTKVCTLGYTNAFSSTPIASGTGYIYVPSALVDTYKVATNWSAYASQFRALEDYTVDGTITGELDESKI